MAEDRSDAAAYLGWFFLGAALGAAAALLMTPKTGRETRDLLAEKSNELAKKAQQIANERRAAPATGSTRAASCSRSRPSGS